MPQQYEYRAILVASGGILSSYKMNSSDINSLNEWFAKGWEYVETMEQKVGGGGSTSSVSVAPTCVIIRKPEGINL